MSNISTGENAVQMQPLNVNQTSDVAPRFTILNLHNSQNMIDRNVKVVEHVVPPARQQHNQGSVNMNGSNVPMWVPIVVSQQQQLNHGSNINMVPNIIQKTSQPALMMPVQQVIQVPRIQPAQPVKLVKLDSVPAVRKVKGVTLLPAKPVKEVKKVCDNPIPATSLPSTATSEPTSVSLSSQSEERLLPAPDTQLQITTIGNHGNETLAGDIQMSPVSIATERAFLLDHTEENGDQITFVGHTDLDLRGVLQQSHSLEQDEGHKDSNHDNTHLTDLEVLLHQTVTEAPPGDTVTVLTAGTIAEAVPVQIVHQVPAVQETVQNKQPEIYCVDCNDSYPVSSGCSEHHTDYQHHPDTLVLSRARASIPSTLSIKSDTRGSKDVCSVWSCRDIKKGTRFGPVIGVELSESKVLQLSDANSLQASNTWKVFGVEGVTRTLYHLDEESSNWTMFVTRACHQVEQNVAVYQEGQELYFVTTKDIEAGRQLLYWYSKPYAQLIGENLLPQDSLICVNCGKTFTDKTTLSRHCQYAHTDASGRKWKCHMCQKGFLTSAKLNTHMMGHLGFKPHACSICDKQFTDKSNLRMHMTIHTGEKKFKCEECGRLFRLKAHLETHMLTHSKEKKLFCTYCQRAFARKSDLTSHTLRHTRAIVLECPTCHKEFFKRQNYQKHLKTHSGIKAFICKFCDKAFGVYFHMTRHMKICSFKKDCEKDAQS